jgi:hypothetical protein
VSVLPNTSELVPVNFSYPSTITTTIGTNILNNMSFGDIFGWLISGVLIGILFLIIFKWILPKFKKSDEIEKLKKNKQLAITVIKNIDSKIKELETVEKVNEVSVKQPIADTSADVLNPDEIIEKLEKDDKKDYEFSVRTSEQEVSHGHETGQKQLDLQIARENRMRKSSE